jgi:hypothetical protein
MAETDDGGKVNYYAVIARIRVIAEFEVGHPSEMAVLCLKNFDTYGIERGPAGAGPIIAFVKDVSVFGLM